MPRPRLRGWTAVKRITASTSAVGAPDWRWGFERRLPHPFNEARTPGSGQGDSSFAHSWAFDMALVASRCVAMVAPEPGPGGHVAGHSEGLGGQGREAYLVAPAGEDAPLGSVDPVGVVGEDGLQRGSHALIGGPPAPVLTGVDGERALGQRWWS